LRRQIEDLRDWSGGSNGVAVEHLARIVGDGSATVRQRLRACAVVLGYKVQNPDITEFAKAFLEHVCGNADIPIDYRIEAGELLRRADGDAQLRPVIERLTPPAPPVDREVEEAARKAEFERKREYIDRATRQIELEYGPQSRSQRTDYTLLIAPSVCETASTV
jgi:hypothetical protein